MPPLIWPVFDVYEPFIFQLLGRSFLSELYECSKIKSFREGFVPDEPLAELEYCKLEVEACSDNEVI